jgi:rhodanese-related sulfurtransferase
VTPRTVDELLASARARLARLAPADVPEALGRGAVLIDIRSDSQRDRDGLVPGAKVIARNQLEWRLDPSSDYRDAGCAHPGAHVILMCDEGYQSSLAAATLLDFGLDATDLEGGFQAWRRAGMPVSARSGTAALGPEGAL